MKTAEKLQEIIAKGGFEGKVAATILASENFKCSWKQWEIIRCSHDDLDFLELNVVTEKSMVLNNAAFIEKNESRMAEQRKTHLS